MKNLENLKAITLCLDAYMAKVGKEEISDMEANKELARTGLLNDEPSHPGRPLRELLSTLRDSNRLPEYIRMKYGTWYIKLSRMMARKPQIDQFQYA